ncbi:MAG: hypothetical protein IPG50_30520 [Myxococcales bacterium]|nr:hypothetical protein [Myxococcales bacterium]
MSLSRLESAFRSTYRLTCTAALGALFVLHAAACGENQTTLPQNASYEAGAPAPLACVPNLDGKIESKELAPSFDVPARFLVNPDGQTRQVDLAGRVEANGQRLWDYSVPFRDDRLATITAQHIEDKWYAGSFPAAEFVAPLELAARNVAVYARSESEIKILGVASVDQNGADGKTLLVYEPPVVLYKLPLVAGATMSSTGTVRNGTLRGQPYAGKDTYETKVDATGRLALPDITFSQTLRVKTLVTVEPIAGAKTTRRQVSYFFECFGEVARIASANNEPAEDFTEAAEFRRLGLGP